MTLYKDWHIPFVNGEITLKEALADLGNVQADQSEIPFMVQLVENPKYSIPGFELFHGAVDLNQHDCIHIVLGRGLLDIDEAFTIGFTMGTTNKVTTTEEKLYTLFAQYLYPEVYKLSDDAVTVFKDAVRLGYISSCVPLDQFDFFQYLDSTLDELRLALGIEPDLLIAYYKIEQKRYPDSIASQRLLGA